MSRRSERIASEPGLRGGWTLPAMRSRGWVVGVVLAILAVGLTSTLLVQRQANDSARREEAALTVRATAALDSVSDAMVAALSGASGMVDASGAVSRERFIAFADGAVDATLIPLLAYLPIVTDVERVRFEALVGAEIIQPVGGSGEAGEYETADRRHVYWPVRWIYPETEELLRVVGFDISAEAVRSEAARTAARTGEISFSRPIPSQANGDIGVFIVKALYRPGDPVETEEQRQAALVGFVTTLAPTTTLLNVVVPQLPSGAAFSFEDGNLVVASTETSPVGGQTQELRQGGRTWVIHVEHHEPEHATTWVLLGATALLAGAVGLFLRRVVRQTGELQAAADNVRRLGRLSERLATADDREEMLRIIFDASAATGATATTVALPGPRNDVLTLMSQARQYRPASRGGSLDEVSVSHNPIEHVDVASSAHTLVGDAWRKATPIFVSDQASRRALYPDDAAHASIADVEAGAAVPLRRPDGELLGVLLWEWRRASRFRDAQRATLLATAEVCQQSLHRAEVQHLRLTSASSMAALSQQLSLARTFDQIAHAVVELGPAASIADSVAIGFIDSGRNSLDLYHASTRRSSAIVRQELAIDPHDDLIAALRHGEPLYLSDRATLSRLPYLSEVIGPEMERLTVFPLFDSENELRAVIAFLSLQAADFRLQPEVGRLATIADLAAQTVERASLYQAEHELVVNLQQQTLLEPPAVRGLAMSARYLPASSKIGLGGDWYDAHPLDGRRVCVVVGDVAGHGIDAIADMTEFRTTISTLIRTETDLSILPALSTSLLRAATVQDMRFATAGLMMLDLEKHTMSYVRAGHPPALVRLPDGRFEVLEAGGGPPIGMVAKPIALQETAIPRGSLIIAYTDGLIERRGESIDDGLERLIAIITEHVGASDGVGVDVDELVERIAERLLGGRHTEDDAALLVIRVDD